MCYNPIPGLPCAFDDVCLHLPYNIIQSVDKVNQLNPNQKIDLSEFINVIKQLWHMSEVNKTLKVVLISLCLEVSSKFTRMEHKQPDLWRTELTKLTENLRQVAS